MNKPEAFWDNASENYDKTEERLEYIHRRSRENTSKFLKDTDTVLDYGCGTGTASCQFSSLVKGIDGIDISSKMISLSKEKAALGKIENVNFEQSDIFDKRYSNESYDVILAFNMLHTPGEPLLYGLGFLYRAPVVSDGPPAQYVGSLRGISGGSLRRAQNSA